MKFFTRAMHVRVKITASICAVAALVVGVIASPVLGATSTDSLAITDISVTAISDTSLSPARHQVVISGTFTNSGQQATSPTIQLVIGNALSSRSAVISAITNDSYPGITVHTDVTTRLSNVPSQRSQEWQLSFNGDDYFAADDPVAVFGAKIADTTEQAVIPHPWFYKATFKPTELLVNVPVTTSSFHPVGQAIDLAVGTNEIDRINTLLDSTPAQANVIVDPYVRDWLRDFDGTDLAGKAAQLSERLNKYSSYSTVYAQTNIFTAVANKMTSISNGALSSEDKSITVYSPEKDFVSKSVFNEVATHDDVLMILPNDAFGASQQTIAAHGISNGTNFLVSDSGLAQCLTVNNALLANACLSSLLTTITAESPNKSRTISVSVPLNAIDVSALKIFSRPESFNKTYELTDINSALASTGISHSIPAGPTLGGDLSTAMRRGLSQLANLSKSVAAVFSDEQLSRQLIATRYFAMSTMSSDAQSNLELVSSATTYATNQLHTLSLQGSSRITIPGTKSQLPITIVNGSDHTATVGIQISSSLPGRISATNIDVVTVEPGKRMTVQIPITVSGAGLISVQASLTSRDNDSFGTPLAIQIASSAYQDIARNLVWTALALLVILLANGLRKRRKSA